jgi:hypothetical protein
MYKVIRDKFDLSTFAKSIVIFLFSIMSCYGFGQDTLRNIYHQFGMGLSLSSNTRYTLVQAEYEAMGGTGVELGLRARYWRVGVTFLLGYSAMHHPSSENLEYSRLRLWGGELEMRLGKHQNWIGSFGYHRHYYKYKSKSQELIPGMTLPSFENKIVQGARQIGAAYQLKPFLRVGIAYQWERPKFERNFSSAYLLFRVSYILDSKKM